MFKNVYLDNAATTPVDKKVLKAMQPYWSKNFGNPSSLYQLGQNTKRAIEKSRKDIADILSCNPNEIIFTGGGTASINLALKGVMQYVKLEENKKSHLIVSSIEHPAVLNTAEYLGELGYEVSILPVNVKGLVELETLKKIIKSNTTLISIMMANNEVGTIQPIREIGKYLEKINKDRENKIYFHTDACQTAGFLDINVNKLHVDLLTLNGSKIYGPKGVGILYVKKGTPLTPLMHGGGQENDLYSGTENIPGIVGLSTALKLVNANKEKENKRLIKLREYLVSEIESKIDKTIFNGHREKRLPNNVNISFIDVEGEAVLLYLDEIGIQISVGSACASKNLDPSHVILALGCPYEVAHGSIRFSLGKHTTKKDLKYVMKKLPGIIEYLRKASPIDADVKILKADCLKNSLNMNKIN